MRGFYGILGGKFYVQWSAHARFEDELALASELLTCNSEIRKENNIFEYVLEIL